MIKKRLPILIGFGLIGAVILLLSLPRERTITLEIEGQPIVVNTSARTVADILDQAGFPLKPADKVSPDRNTRLRDGETIILNQASRINLIEESNTQMIYSTDRIPQLWLDQAGIKLDPADRILVNGKETEPDSLVVFQPHITLELRRAVTISLESGGRVWTIRSAAPTLGRALWDAGFLLTASDMLQPAPDTPLNADLKAVLVANRQIQVSADGQTVTAATSANTVGEAIAQAGFSLQGLDYSIPAEDAPIPEDGIIQIVRVVEEVVINQETIPYQTLFQPLDDVEIDNYKVAQLGQVGITAKRVRIRTEDGQEISRSVESEWVLREPVNRIEGYGTKIVIRTEVVGGETIEYWRKVDAWATSYSPCNSGVDECLYSTSMGIPVDKGIVAVILDWYRAMANHTVYVPGYGPAIIADVGPGFPGKHWIDLGYPDESYVPWAKWVTIYFTTPVPPADEILYVLPYK